MQKSFAQKYKVISTNYDDVMDLYDVEIIFFAVPDKTYTFTMDGSFKDKSASDVADEIKKQLQGRA